MADNGIDWGQLGKSLIGQSDRQVLDRETDIYRNPGDVVKRTGIEKIMDGIFRGGSSAALQELSEERYIEGLKKEFRKDLAGIDADVARSLNLPSVDKLDKDDSVESLTKSLNTASRLQTARRTAEATRDDTGRLQEIARSSTNPEEILKAVQDANLRQSRTDSATDPETIKADKRYVDATNLQTAMLGHQMQQSNNQFALQQDQLRLDRRRMDMQEARADRRDRQAMIQQMMQGLAALGTSIAI